MLTGWRLGSWVRPRRRRMGARPRREAAAPEPHLSLAANPAPGAERRPSPWHRPPLSSKPAQGWCPPRCCCGAGGRLTALILPSSPLCRARATAEGRARVPFWARLGREEGRVLRGWGSPAGAGFGLSDVSGQWQQGFGGLGGVGEGDSD